MDRRDFVRMLAAISANAAAGLDVGGEAARSDRRSLIPALELPAGLPTLRVVSGYAPAASPGMPGPYPGRVVAVTLGEIRRYRDRRGERRGRPRDDGARHAHADRRGDDARRVAAVLRAGRPRRHQGELRRASALRLRLRDRRRGRPPAHGHRRAGCRRSTSTSASRISSTR